MKGSTHICMTASRGKLPHIFCVNLGRSVALNTHRCKWVDNSTTRHGRMFTDAPADPDIVWTCSEKPRDDHDTPSWLQATEFEDKLTVLVEHKIHGGRNFCICDRAGAKSGYSKVGVRRNAKAVNPTYTHRALTLLHDHEFIQSWQQQNHDGLPQKAGFPQHKLNEIHGSWYDPGNPVVKYNGSLHDLAYPWMLKDARAADVALVIGTTLSGLNADRVVTDTCERSLHGKALGGVCINLQQTQHDDKMTLRVFGKSDKVLQLLLRELGISDDGIADTAAAHTPVAARWRHVPSSVLVPYDKDGIRVLHPCQWMRLDLSNGATVRLSPGHNIQGAMQPCYMHIGAVQPTSSGSSTTTAPALGHGVVTRRNDDICGFELTLDGARFTLGVWWLHAAMHGTVSRLPIVNLHPRFEDVPPRAR